MDIKRRIMLNTVPPDVVYIGNTMEMIQIRNAVEDGVPLAITGDGKYTAMRKIECDSEYEFVYSHNGKDFKDEPLISYNTRYIIRDPKKGKKLNEYLREKAPVYLLYDNDKDIPMGLRKIYLKPLNDKQKELYKKEKGMDLIHTSLYKSVEEYEGMRVVKFMKGIIDDPPEHTHKWLAQNYPNTAIVQKICYYAAMAKDTIYYKHLLRLINLKRMHHMVFPKWVKLKND